MSSYNFGNQRFSGSNAEENRSTRRSQPIVSNSSFGSSAFQPPSAAMESAASRSGPSVADSLLLDMVEKTIDSKLTKIDSKLWELERTVSKNEEMHSQILHVFNTRFNELSNRYPPELGSILQKLDDRLVKDTEMLGIMRAIDIKTEMTHSKVDNQESFEKIQNKLSVIHKDIEIFGKTHESKRKDDILLKLHKAVDDTYAKASDAKSASRDCVENTSSILSRVSKLQKSVDSMEKGSRHRSRQTHSPSSSGDESKTELKAIRELVEDRVLPNISSIRKTVENKSRRKVSTETINEIMSGIEPYSQTDDKRINSLEHNSPPPMLQSSKRTFGGESGSEIECTCNKSKLNVKLDAWLKQSRKSVAKSDENMNSVLEKLTSMAKAIETMLKQEKTKHSNVLEKVADIDSKMSPKCEVTFTNKIVSEVNSKLCEFGSMIESLHNDQSKQIHDLNFQVRTLNESQMGKIEEVLQKSRSTLKVTSANEKTGLAIVSMLKNGDATSPSKSHLSELQPKLDDMYIRVLPVLEEIRKLQRQRNDKDELEEVELRNHVQKILDIVEDIKENMVPKQLNDNITTVDSSTTLQVFNALNELKIQLHSRDQGTMKMLNDLRFESNKNNNRLYEILKTKSTEKLLSKVLGSVEEQKRNSLNDMKTLSNMNTLLQGIKASENKTFSQVKDLKEFVENRNVNIRSMDELLCAQTEEIALRFKSQQDKLLPEGILQPLIERLEEIFTDKWAQIQVFLSQQHSSGYSDHQHPSLNIFEEKLLEQTNKVLLELPKKTIDAEILNSIEDLKQLVSSIPIAINELVPRLDKVTSDVSKIPDDSYTAAFEENLCLNLEGRVKEVHRETLRELSCKFDAVEQRIGSFNRFVKKSDSSPDEHLFSNDKMEILMHVSNECKVLANGVNKAISNSFKGSDNKVLSIIQEMQAFEKQLLQLTKDRNAGPHTVDDKVIKVIEKMELSIDKKLKSHQVVNANGRNNRLSAFEGQLKQLEERLCSSHENLANAVDDLKDVVGVATVASADPELPSTLDSVKQLVVQLKRVQHAQDQILKQGDKTIEYQTETNEIFVKIVPTLELIQSALEGNSKPPKTKNVANNMVLLPKLCNELKSKISALSELETKLMSIPRTKSCDDLRLLIQTCASILDRLLSSDDGSDEIMKTEPVEHENREEEGLPLSSKRKRQNQDFGEINEISSEESNKKHKSSEHPIEPLVVSKPDGKLVIRPKVLKLHAESENKKNWGPKRFRACYTSGEEPNVADKPSYSENDAKRPEFQPHVVVSNMSHEKDST